MNRRPGFECSDEEIYWLLSQSERHGILPCSDAGGTWTMIKKLRSAPEIHCFSKKWAARSHPLQVRTDLLLSDEADIEMAVNSGVLLRYRISALSPDQAMLPLALMSAMRRKRTPQSSGDLRSEPGPKETFNRHLRCCGAARRTRHSLRCQNP